MVGSIIILGARGIIVIIMRECLYYHWKKALQIMTARPKYSPEELNKIKDETAKQFNIRGVMLFLYEFQDELSSGFCIFSLFSPQPIIFIRSGVKDYTPEEIRGLFGHELAHVITKWSPLHFLLRDLLEPVSVWAPNWSESLIDLTAAKRIGAGPLLAILERIAQERKHKNSALDKALLHWRITRLKKLEKKPY